MHKSEDQLREEISKASEIVEINATYMHSKSRGLYVVRGFSVLESTNEILVRYASIETEIEFARPVNQFVESVLIDEKMLARFKLLE